MKLGTKHLVCELLDKAVADIAGRIVDETIGQLSADEKKVRIREASDSLDELRKNGTPDYQNELVAAFYMIQYQLQHINLAYSMIMSASAGQQEENAVVVNEELHVIDFGCGALVMRFGVLLAVSDFLEAGHHISNVRIDSLDPAVPVVQLGMEIWDRFFELLNGNKDSNLRWLIRALGTIERPYPELKLGVLLNEIQAMPDAASWLSAIHVVYRGLQGNSDEVRQDLAFLEGAHDPSLGFLTTHYTKEETALEVSPFGQDYDLTKQAPSPQFENSMGAPLCTDLLHVFRPNYWRTFWEWDPGTRFLSYRKSPV